MDDTELDRLEANWRERQKNRVEPPKPKPPECPQSPDGRHDFNTAYKSSSGRRMCIHCNVVTDKPFDTLGVAEGKVRE